MRLIKTFILSVLTIFSLSLIVQTGCSRTTEHVSVSSKGDEANSSTESRIENINKKHLPYLDITLSLNIESPELREYIQNSKGQYRIDASEVYLVTLKDNRYFIEISAAATDLGKKNDSFKSALDDGYNDVVMLLKYLQGFYYGILLTPNVVEIKYTAAESKYELNYEYKGIKCKNVATFHEGFLYRARVYQTAADTYDVEIKYNFKERNGLYYLEGFRSENRHHGFLFNYYIRYKNLSELLVPSMFNVEVKWGNKSMRKSMRYVYIATNHKIDTIHRK